jgi:hypothetical protein
MATRRWVLLFILLVGAAFLLWKTALVRHLFTRPRRKGKRIPLAKSLPEKKERGR